RLDETHVRAGALFELRQAEGRRELDVIARGHARGAGEGRPADAARADRSIGLVDDRDELGRLRVLRAREEVGLGAEARVGPNAGEEAVDVEDVDARVVECLLERDVAELRLTFLELKTRCDAV